ncbi:MAG TPA: DUF535 family protein [Chthoniobacterales bacterium]|nr:DUF535 family protein [Chthoniobacterales bacterium]
MKLRLKFVIAALRAPSVSRRLAANAGSPVGDLLAECPDTVGTLLWPYQCASWDAETRFSRIAEHLNAVREIPGLALALDDKLVLADLSSISPGVSLILDRAPWLAREGHLTLSLFKHEFRAFTVSFSLLCDPELTMFIGGLQGRQSDDILALYRELTKDFEGMRPRDFLLEALRLFAMKIGVRHIYAVADEHRISRHDYFAGKQTTGTPYNDVWLERGASRVAPTHFELPLAGSRRLLDEVSAKKRSMYRRRYEMLDAIEAAMPGDMTSAERRHFDAQ